MNIILKGADFSANRIATISQVSSVKKIEGRSLADLGSMFENGQKLRFILTIDECGSYSGTSVPFGFAVGSGAVDYDIAVYMDNAPHFYIVLQNGATYNGEQIIQRITTEKTNVKLSTYNVSYSTIKWHVEYYIETM